LKEERFGVSPLRVYPHQQEEIFLPFLGEGFSSNILVKGGEFWISRGYIEFFPLEKVC